MTKISRALAITASEGHPDNESSGRRHQKIAVGDRRFRSLNSGR